LWFQHVSVGAFAKARGFSELYLEYLVLLAFGVAYLALTCLFLRKQEN
jgi:ribosome-dependent ATPase